jgi:hypothetical protein
MASRDKMFSGVGMPSALDGAIEAYVDRFGVPPEVADLEGLGRDRELADLIWVAIRVGTPFDTASIANAWAARLDSHQ